MGKSVLPLSTNLFCAAMLPNQFILSCICSGDGLKSAMSFSLKIKANSFIFLNFIVHPNDDWNFRTGTGVAFFFRGMSVSKIATNGLQIGDRPAGLLSRWSDSGTKYN